MNLLTNLLAFQDTELAEEAAAATTAVDPAGMSGWLVLLIVVGMLVLPFVVGQFLANALKLKDLGLKMGIVLFAVTLGAAPFVSQMIAGHPLNESIRLGIDLAGGTNMVFQVDHAKAQELEKEVDSLLMDRMVGAVSRRLNEGGVEEVTVRRVGADRIEIIVPGADAEEAESIKKRVTQLGSLEFGLLANRFEHQTLINEAMALPDDVNDLYRGDVLRAKWRPGGLEDAESGKRKEVGHEFGVASRVVQIDGKDVEQFLVVVDPEPKRRITGRLLKRAFEDVNSSGAPCVGFEFNTQGGYLFQQLTARHMPKQGSGYKTRLAVLLNEEIHSAPSINDMIGSRGIIEGDYDSAELNELINVLNAGALDVPLQEEPISEFSVSPTLGTDVRESGFNAIRWAIVAVFVVTLGYYLFAGAVADVCLGINILLLMGSMSLINATFTLPGLAGIALAVGMAVDANVLIFERIREEQAKGSSLRMSIQNGFGKALSAIVDSNVTTLITAAVLYVMGTEQVKGFAVTLFIGLIWNMFCAIYVARLIFDVFERKRWIKTVKMFSLIKGGNFDFVGKKRIAMGGSLALIAIGLIALAVRGRDMLDIDFRGGAMVSFEFVGDQPTTDEVRAALLKQFDESISLEELTVPNPESGENETLFRMRTILDDDDQIDQIGEMVSAAFAQAPYDQYELVRQHVTLGNIEPVADDEAADDADAPAEASVETPNGHQAPVSLSQPVITATLANRMSEALDTVMGTEDGESASLVAIAPATPGATGKLTDYVFTARPELSQENFAAALAAMQTKLESEPAFEEKTTFETSVAADTQVKALIAILLSNLAIVFYLWFRFQRVTFGLAAVVAVVHDVLGVIGLLALGAYLSRTPIGGILALHDFKVDLSIVAAILTIIGYSLNDTIVVFDRIREVRGKNPAITEAMVNTSLNQTLSRTLLTSSTTLIVLFIMYLIGGDGLHGFAYCMLLGILLGTFSSIWIASPVLVWLANRDTTGTTKRSRELAATT